jgi:hypothetical protein
MEFRDTDGTSINPEVPGDLGGIYSYCDGPISVAGTFIGTVKLTWTLEYKGLRMDDNVVQSF